MISRRAFIGGLAGGLLAAPLAAHAQVGKVPRIGLLLVWSSTDPLNGLIRQALGEAGYAEGRTIIIEYRRAEGKTERLPALAAELVQLNVNAIIIFGDPSIRAVQQATKAIPIVGGTDDLAAARLVESFARPQAVGCMPKLGFASSAPRVCTLSLNDTIRAEQHGR